MPGGAIGSQLAPAMRFQLALDSGRAREPAEHEGGSRERRGRKSEGEEVEPGDGHIAEETGVESATVGTGRRSSIGPATGDAATGGIAIASTASRGSSTRVALHTIGFGAFVAALLAAVAGDALLILSNNSGFARIVAALAAAVVLVLELLVDLLGRRRVLLQHGIEKLRARGGRQRQCKHNQNPRKPCRDTTQFPYLRPLESLWIHP